MNQWISLVTLLAVICVSELKADESQRHILSLKTQALLHARSVDELNRREEELLYLEQSRNFCRHQLQEHQVPVDCFRALKLEERVGLISEAKYKIVSQFLLQRCIAGVQQIGSLQEIALVADKSHLPKGCQQSLKHREEDIIYQMEESQPAELLDYWMSW